jgi:hypothetical protein
MSATDRQPGTDVGHLRDGVTVALQRNKPRWQRRFESGSRNFNESNPAVRASLTSVAQPELSALPGCDFLNTPAHLKGFSMFTDAILDHLREFGIGVLGTVLFVGMALLIPMFFFDSDVFCAVDECRELEELDRIEAAIDVTPRID